MRDLWSSKKFKTALFGFVTASAGIVARQFGVDISAQEIALVLSPLAFYILGQGIADNGKEAARAGAGKAK